MPPLATPLTVPRRYKDNPGAPIPFPGPLCSRQRLPAYARIGESEPAMTPSTLLHRVVLRNYKSFASCDVGLAPLTFVVGANGSGKSNFLDALRFISDALRTSLEHAVRERGGIGAICRRSAGYPAEVGIRLDLILPNGQEGFYALEISARGEFDYAIHREECHLSPLRVGGFPIEYRVENSQAHWSVPPHAPPAVAADRLFLVAASGLAEFRPLYDALSRMGFYNLIPEQMREVQAQDAGDFLERNGSNLASVLARLANRSPETKERIEQYLAGSCPAARKSRRIKGLNAHSG